jgi:hypothetical protein
LRIRGDSYRPPVFESRGDYEVRVGDPDLDSWKTLSSLQTVKVPEGTHPKKVLKF